MAKKPEKLIDKALVQARANIMLMEQRIEAVLFASRTERLSKDGQQAVTVLLGALYERQNEFYRTYLMWGHMTDDLELKLQVQEEAVSMVHAAKGETQFALMHFLNRDGRIPNGWLSSVEDRFREEIAETKERISQKRKERESRKGKAPTNKPSNKKSST